MFGVSKANIRKLVGSDVRTVAAEAQHLIWVHADENGKYVVKSEENLDGKLSIIAVVGEGQLEGVTYPLVLLCEIGLRRGKPYQRSRPFKKRRSWFSMTDLQYQAAAPRIFSILQKIADRKISSWKFGNRNTPRKVWVSFERWSRKKGEMIKKYKPPVLYLNSIRFSVLPKEELLIHDLYWAEANINLDIAHITGGLVAFIKKVLSRYQYQRPNRKDLFSLKWPRIMRKKILSSSLPMHLKYKLLKDNFSESPYWEELRSIFKWDGESMPPECELINARPRHDLGKVQLRILPRSDHKYVIFEMYQHI